MLYVPHYSTCAAADSKVSVFNGSPANCFPAATGVAATFDFNFAVELGTRLADDCKAKGMDLRLREVSLVQPRNLISLSRHPRPARPDGKHTAVAFGRPWLRNVFRGSNSERYDSRCVHQGSAVTRRRCMHQAFRSERSRASKVCKTVACLVRTLNPRVRRFSVSSEVSERALREVYLKTFQIAIKLGDPWVLMSA